MENLIFEYTPTEKLKIGERYFCVSKNTKTILGIAFYNFDTIDLQENSMCYGPYLWIYCGGCADPRYIDCYKVPNL